MTIGSLRYRILATDYDGTLADDGSVAPAVLDGLRRLKASGRRVVLVTGRELEELFEVFPHVGLCDRIVAENGGVLYRPATRDVLTLAGPPARPLIERLERRGVRPLSIGRVIVASRTPHEGEIAEAIDALGLDLQIVHNKGALMVLPSGIDKATGLRRALEDIGGSGADTVGIGDAENDEPLRDVCAACVAVANAVESFRARAHLVTAAPAGEGVLEIVEALLSSDGRPH